MSEKEASVKRRAARTVSAASALIWMTIASACTGELAERAAEVPPGELPKVDLGQPPVGVSDGGFDPSREMGADMADRADMPAVPPPPSCTEDDFWPTSAPLRRLTNRELVNTLNAVFYGHDYTGQDTLHDNERLQPDEPSSFWTEDSFVNKAANQRVGALKLERLEDFILWYVDGTQPGSGDGGVNYRTSKLPGDHYILFGNEEFPGWSPCRPERDAPKEEFEACGEELVRSVMPKLYRRPLEAEEQQEIEALFAELLSEQFAAEGEISHEDRFRRSVSAFLRIILQSPDLLYRPEFGQPTRVKQGQAVHLTDHELASRLSYFLWQSMPDEELLRAADRGELQDEAKLKAQIERMMGHPRARRAMRDFFTGWLKLDKLSQLAGNVDPHKNPAVDGYLHTSSEIAIDFEGERQWWTTWGALHRSLRSATLDYIDWLFWEADSWQELAAGDQMFSTAVMSDLYGLEPVARAPAPDGYDPSDSPYSRSQDYITTLSRDTKRITAPADRYRGLFTQPGLLAITSHGEHHSPIFRGVHFTEAVLCGSFQGQPNPEPEEIPEVETCTTRDEVEFLHSFSASCQGCHQMIDPAGFAFEHYDEIGLWRDEEHGCAVDASVSFPTRGAFATDVGGDYRDALELADTLATSRDAKACMVTHWMRYALGEDEVTMSDRALMDQPELAHRKACQQHQIAALVDDFEASGGSLQQLVVSIAMSPSFRLKPAPAGPLQQAGGAP